MEKNKHTGKIIHQYLSHRHSPETEEKVRNWLLENKNDPEKEEMSFHFWNSIRPVTDKNTLRSLNKVRMRVNMPNPVSKTVSLSAWIRVAAILLPILVIGGLLYFYYQPDRSELVEIQVPYGENKLITLADGSRVTLNSGTTFRYPENFEGNERKVYLNGEAFFSVTKNTGKPFIVSTKNISVKVLGTQFNVKAYPTDLRTITTLQSGRVEIHTNTHQKFVLKPDQQLTFNNKTRNTRLTNVAAEEFSGWINGKLIFENASFSEIIRTLERHFNVKIEITGTAIAPPEELYTVKFLKNENLDEIFNVLKEIVGNFLYQKNGTKIQLKKI